MPMDMSQFTAGLPRNTNVFADVLNTFQDDQDCDTIAFMTIADPLFDAYAEATRSRKFTIDTGTPKKPNPTDYFVFCTGIANRGTFKYRIIRIDSKRNLDILEIDRLLDDSELFRGGFKSRAREQAIKPKQGIWTAA